MSQILSEVLASNRACASNFGDKSKLALPPARRFAILTCMDARLDPAKYAGLSEGDAHGGWPTLAFRARVDASISAGNGPSPTSQANATGIVKTPPPPLLGIRYFSMSK